MLAQFKTHITKQYPRCSRETVGKTSCSVLEVALSAQFVREDIVFNFICKLDAIIERREDFDAAGNNVVYK